MVIRVGPASSPKSADGKSQHWRDYDAFGQAWRFIDERNNTTNLTYQWGPMKKLDTVTTYRTRDPASGGGIEPQPTNFEYDGMGRPQWIIFPDGTSELTTYLYGQPDAFKTRKNQGKRMYYDARGREDYHTWDADAAPGIDRTWDNANRLTTISNSVATINYGYDDAAQVRWESEYVAGADTSVQTNYLRYPDGAIWNLQYPNGMLVARSYTARGQLEYVWEKRTGSWRESIHYVYLADGKMWYQDHGNGIRASFDYDARGFTRVVHNYRLSSSENLSYRAYYRDERDRIVAWQKSTVNAVNPMENGRGDHYRYDEEGQLASAWYETIDPANTYGNCQRQDHFGYDELGNRRDWNHVASRSWQYFPRKDNGLNQYRAWSPYSIINYDDDIGGGWGGPAAANGVLMQDGNITAGFNALNQPMYIWSGTSGWISFGYDPLGRCVKRWNDNGSATYLYYDGWNLIQEGPQSWNPSRLYVHGARVDEVVAQITPGSNALRYFHYDANGNCILQTDGSGALLEQYSYDAFGYPYFHDRWGNNLGYSPSGNRFLFSGREWLNDLKLYDFRHRMYHPELGRFLQPDPKHFAAGDYNLYRYCHNDPVNRIDPMGLADTVTIVFVPDVGNLFVQVQPDPVVDAAYQGARAVSLIAPQGGLTTTATTDKTTGDIHVQQRIKITTWIKQSEDKAGNTPELSRKELLRVDKFREGVPAAQSKANALAEKGFKDEESAKKAVEESTKAEMLKKAREGKLKWDLPGGGK